MERLILCKIKKGKNVRLIWLEEKLAKFGKQIKIRVKNGSFDRGWVVIRVRKASVSGENVIACDDKEGERLRLAA